MANSNKRILTIIGARPQFVKAAVVSRVLREEYPNAKEVIIHTGQHYDANMSDVFFEELDIPAPDYHLGIGGGTHGQNTGRMVESIEAILLDKRPDWVLVYGDTDSTLAGALAAAKLHIPIAHIEAGLRSFNRKMPEEINRILTDHTASLLFTPTDTATQNLLKEGVSRQMIHQVGDVMYDAAKFYAPRSKKPDIRIVADEFILATIHRAENTDDPTRLGNIIGALAEIALQQQVILPLHPRTRARLADSGISTHDITVIDPIGYLEMVWLLQHCSLVITDSGGLQKESYFFGKQCIITRDETEWVELVQSGWNAIAGASDSSAITDIARRCIKPDSSDKFYGDGHAGVAICEAIICAN